MCGICGVIGGPLSERTESQVRRMMDRLAHRGPDDEGFLIEPGAVLGMCRLSIIDLEGGRQPIYSEDGTVAVVFNGEIYNFPELRTALEGRGHRFRTRSDTEVVVHAYEEWGEHCVERLRGMFAFALWDSRSGGPERGRVLLARDRLGIKPLYYAAADGMLLFSSEVRSLLASGAIPRRVARESVEAYLLFGSVVEPMTLVEGVFSLPPGYVLMVSCEAPSSGNPAPYWDPASSARPSGRKAPTNFSAAAREVRPILKEAVRSHLLADVPVGVFLSSGIDSTAIAALAARERRGLHTFTVVFPEQQFSEAPLARATAARLGTDHSELLVTADKMQAHLLDAVAALDQPSMDGVNTYFVSGAARRAGLKVALSGLGGDEVFGGYPSFRLTPRLAKLATLARMVPSVLRDPILEVVVAISRRMAPSGQRDALRKLAAVWRDPRALPHPYFFSRTVFTPGQIEELLVGGARTKRHAEHDRRSSSPWRAWLEHTVAQAARLGGDSAVSCLELRTYMVNTLLRDTDSMSMHHSLEVRVPFLDHPLVEFVAALPDRARSRPNVIKALLVEALGDLLPHEVAHQPKRTFTLPWQSWLRGLLGLEVALRLGRPTPSLASLLDAESVQTVWRSFLAGRTGWSRPWSLFVLNEWVRHHLDEAGGTAKEELASRVVLQTAAAPGGDPAR